MKIGVVTAEFNLEITEKLEAGAQTALREAGVLAEDIVTVRVPGAVELPLAASALVDAGCKGVVALGCVIRGETTHYDSVCRMAEYGCMKVSLERRVPIGFGVITVENDAQAMARAGGAEGNKGADAALVVLQMLKILKTVKL